MINPDPDGVSWLRVVLAFAIVFGLLAMLGFILKRINLQGLRMPGAAARASLRLEIVETLPLDVRRRLVIVRCDEEEHLLLLNTSQDIVVSSSHRKNPPNED
jgi:flagellar protein FliO/FliZ